VDLPDVCGCNYHAGMTTRPRLDAVELNAWRTFLRAHAQVTRRLEADLVAEHDLSLPTYDVLVQLSEAPDGRLRMTDLAERVLLSRSGLTRLVDRLEREGLVRRQACPSDARGTLAALTPAGLERLRDAWPTHLRGVSDYVTARLTPEELETLAALLGRLVTDPVPAGVCGAVEGAL
jgi:DNA-binding MarR family transcriptional regulator